MIVGFDADQDCSPVAAKAVAAGATFVCRYLKNLSAREVAALSAAKLRIVSIWETTAERALSGEGGGVYDGAQAVLKAQALGQPEGSAIVATVDFDCTAAQQPAVLAYLRAFKDELAGKYKLMVYANGAVCQAALDARIADYTWLAGGHGMRGSAAFYAGNRWTLAQDVGDKRNLALGIDIDSDIANGGDFGGWMLGEASAPMPTQPTPSKPAPRASVMPDLREAQAELGVTADGIWGPATAAAFAAFYRPAPADDDDDSADELNREELER